MRRSHLLVATVVVVFATAAGLRLRSHFRRMNVSLEGYGRSATRPAAINMPRDYVVDPWVHPAEADRGPKRIISLAPSITEILCALGMRDRLVGRTQFCRHPPGVKVVAQVGALIDTNFEKIKSLAPDLVLTTANSGPVIDRLDMLEIPHAAVPHDSLEEVYSAIERIGQLCDRPKTAGALIACIRADVHSLQNAAETLKMPQQNVLVALGDLPASPKPVWVAGPGSFLDALVQLAGHTNAAGQALRSSHGQLPLEKLLALDVDVILTFGEELSDRQRAELCLSWSEAGSLRAIRERRVRCVGGPEWESAGPRIAIALHRFVTVLSQFR